MICDFQCLNLCIYSYSVGSLEYDESTSIIFRPNSKVIVEVSFPLITASYSCLSFDPNKPVMAEFGSSAVQWHFLPMCLFCIQMLFQNEHCSVILYLRRKGLLIVYLSLEEASICAFPSFTQLDKFRRCRQVIMGHQLCLN